MKAKRAVAALLLAASVLVSITACAGTTAGTPGGGAPDRPADVPANALPLKAVEDYAGLPEGMVGLPEHPAGDPQLYWLKDGKQIGITLWGSSTCPPIVESLTPTSSNAFIAEQAPIPAKPCTRDLVPHTTVFTTPSDTATSSDVTIVLDGTSLTLRARTS